MSPRRRRGYLHDVAINRKVVRFAAYAAAGLLALLLAAALVAPMFSK